MLDRKFQTAAGAVVAAIAAAAVPCGTAQAATPAQDGWMRLAHLSPNTPPVDVYLYAFGGTSAQTVLRHVAYGTASPYESLPPGLYTVAMRATGADAASAPVISTSVDVRSGAAYTVAGLGPSSALSLSVLSDRLGAPAGKADVRIIEASLQHPNVTVSTGGSPSAAVSAGGGPIVSGLRFPTVTDYRTVAAGPWDIAVQSDASAITSRVNLHTGSTYTIAILDGAGNAPRVLNLTDSAGSVLVPKGGVAAGFGATGARQGSVGALGALEAEMFWGGLLIAGATGAGFALRHLRRF